MFGGFQFTRLLASGAATALLTAAALAQSPHPFVLQAIPTGLRPLGVDVAANVGGSDDRQWTAVANSGDNSVSVFVVRPAQTGLAAMALSTVIPGIASPYAVVPCPDGRFLVTSPSANSFSLIDPRAGTLVRTVRVGPQPFSAACDGNAVVSNYGDNSLSVVDLTSFAVIKTIPNVPASRGLHGLRLGSETGRWIAWVAGTDADVVTLVDLATARVAFSFPVRRPTAVSCCGFSGLSIASSLDNSIVEVDPSTLQRTLTLRNVPTPQDVRGAIATTGAGNAIAWIRGEDSVTLIPGMPGAAGVAVGGGRSRGFFGPPPYFVVTSPDSNRVFFIQGQPPAPSQFRVANAASFEPERAAPGSLASIFASTGVSRDFHASSLPLPRTLGGVRLRLGGAIVFDIAGGWTYSPVGSVEAPLVFAGPNQINFQIPPELSPGPSVPAQLVRADGSSLISNFPLSAAAPGIFTLPMSGRGQAAVLNQDSSLNFGTNPAARGSVIQIFATGAGETDPPLLAGEPAPVSGNPLILTRVQPTVTIGGLNARVLFSGMAPGWVGLWQINAEVPQDVAPGPAVPMTITAGGVASNTVTIAVQ